MHPQKADDSIINNIRTSSSYKVEDLNYFIDAPIELHILEVLWTMTVGKKIDAKLSDYCLANRLEINDDDDDENKTKKIQLFKLFHFQYSKWRDNAIKKAQSALENETDILLIGLDLKQCFYHLQPDFNKIKADNASSPMEEALCEMLKSIHVAYHDKIEKYLCKTHRSASKIRGLPVGLTSSRVLCNWCLSCFDNEIKEKLNPLYYGRYVDDIIIVIQSPERTIRMERESIIENLFIKKGVFKKDGEKIFIKCEREFCFNEDKKTCNKCLKNVHIQKDKLIIHYYNHEQSHVGLKQFRKEISAQSSEFRFFPEGDDVRGLDDSAYDLIYKGSINKLASLIGLKENVAELKKYLIRKIIQYRLCGEEIDKQHIEQIFRFFQGKNILEFHSTWETLLTLLLINKKESDCAKFYKTCKDIILSTFIDKKQDDELTNLFCISFIDYLSPSLVIALNISLSTYMDVSKVQASLTDYLSHSLAMALSLKIDFIKKKDSFPYEIKSKKLKKILKDTQMIDKTSISIRKSNILRHNYVKFPLINYTKYDGDLIEFTLKDDLKLEVNEKSVKFTPRFLHNDEIRMFALLRGMIDSKESNDNFSYSEKIYNILKTEDPAKAIDSNSDKNDKIQIKVIYEDNKDTEKIEDKRTLVIGIANIKVNEEDIERCYNPHKLPNLSFNRQTKLYKLLNESIRTPKCDLLVFPELSIPFFWMPTMVALSRKEQVGIVFGTEHIVINKKAYNFVFTVLPYKNNSYRQSFVSARLKNYYAPKEENDLNLYYLTAVSPKELYYEIFNWKRTKFSVFNCFELTDIAHRGLMRSEVDFLVTVAWNRDISYYDHILTSTARDLHCYVIHANTSQFGDSRITAPTRTEEMDYVRVKGGINHTLLKAKIDLDELRDFHSKKYDPLDKRFKPLPAGFTKNYD